MSTFLRIVDAMSEFAGRLSAWLFFAIALFVPYEVLMRNVFVSPTIWVDEVNRIMQIWAAYLAAAYVLKHHEMITIDVAFSDRTTLARRLSETLAIVMLFIFAGTAVYYGFGIWLDETLAGHTTDSFLALPLWLTKSSVWVGFALLCLQGVAELYRIWTVGVPPSGHDPELVVD